MIFAHSVFGVFITYAFLKILPYKFDNWERSVLWFTGIVSSVLPDFDIVMYSWCSNCSHRNMLTHGLPLYIFFTLLLFACSLLFKNKKLVVCSAFLFLISVSGHLFLDMLTGGLVLFAPFSYKKIGIFSLPEVESGSSWLTTYFSSFWFYLELTIVLIYVLIAGSLKKFIVWVLPLLFLCASLISAFAVF